MNVKERLVKLGGSLACLIDWHSYIYYYVIGKQGEMTSARQCTRCNVRQVATPHNDPDIGYTWQCFKN